MSATVSFEAPNYVGGVWSRSASQEILDVINPAKTEVIGRVAMSGADDVEMAVNAAEAACTSGEACRLVIACNIFLD
jgi:acyl-CoA reductase-like NAD-dependent aldehyde dehydrogenase